MELGDHYAERAVALAEARTSVLAACHMGDEPRIVRTLLAWSRTLPAPASPYSGLWNALTFASSEGRADRMLIAASRPLQSMLGSANPSGLRMFKGAVARAAAYLHQSSTAALGAGAGVGAGAGAGAGAGGGNTLGFSATWPTSIVGAVTSAVSAVDNSITVHSTFDALAGIVRLFVEETRPGTPGGNARQVGARMM
jgi:hypothetical protein